MKAKIIFIIQAQLFCLTLAQEELELLSTEAKKVVGELINRGAVHGTTKKLYDTDIYKSCQYSARVEFGRETWKLKKLISGMTFQIDDDELETYISGDTEEVELWAFGKIEATALLQENIQIKRGRKQQVSCLFGIRSCNLWPGYPKTCFTTLSVD